MTDEVINFLVYFTEKEIEKSKEKIKLDLNIAMDKTSVDLLNFHIGLAKKIGEVTAYQHALQAIKAQLKSEEGEE